MRILTTDSFELLLNSAQIGYAHLSWGTEFSIVIQSILSSLCFCILQLGQFCILRSLFCNLYQPRSYCVPKRERVSPLPRGLFGWFIPTFRYDLTNYLKMGLDSYFFVRFIAILLLFFLVSGFLNLAILMPMNLSGREIDTYASGFDKLSLSNIPRHKIGFLNGHFVMSVIDVMLLQLLILYELENCVMIRQVYFDFATSQNCTIQKTVLFTHVPRSLRNVDAISNCFKVVPGGIRTVWFLEETGQIEEAAKYAEELVELLEVAIIKYMQRRLVALQSARQQAVLSKWRRLWGLKKRGLSHVDCSRADKISSPYFHPPIKLGTFMIPHLQRRVQMSLPGSLRFFLLKHRVPMIDWCITELNITRREIDALKTKFKENSTERKDKVLIEFCTPEGASIAHQCLRSHKQGELESSVTQVNPDDILWGNVTRKHSAGIMMERSLVTCVFIGIIILYVVPVSMIGLISQVPLLTKFLPCARWLYSLPEEVREVVSNLLPSILLSILTEFVLVAFRYLAYFKGFASGCELELDLQNWYFAFLFIHQFLVLTILSSITVVLERIVDQPISIPAMLANNLPKAATFFYQYITWKAFAFCGNNFLRFDQLINRISARHFRVQTPRQLFRQTTILPQTNWGTIYPVFSVYGCIGVVYSIISPLICIFIIFILSLVLLYYKYALRFVYSASNVSETHGRLYPVALFHLYWGVYCLECCMIGVLFLLKNNLGRAVLHKQGWFMVFALVTTAFIHHSLLTRYRKLFSCSPILSAPPTYPKDAHQCSTVFASKEMFDRSLQSMYQHPSMRYVIPELWIPADAFGISEELHDHLNSMIPGINGSSSQGATIELTRRSRQARVVITSAPPGYE